MKKLIIASFITVLSMVVVSSAALAEESIVLIGIQSEDGSVKIVYLEPDSRMQHAVSFVEPFADMERSGIPPYGTAWGDNFRLFSTSWTAPDAVTIVLLGLAGMLLGRPAPQAGFVRTWPAGRRLLRMLLRR